MAEAFANTLFGPLIRAFSAGTHPRGIDPLAVKTMEEIGIDISGNRSKHISDFIGENLDLVITVCDDAREECPYFPGAKRTVHVGFEDPPYLARNASSEEEALLHYRRVRDEIGEFVSKLPEILQEEE